MALLPLLLLAAAQHSSYDRCMNTGEAAMGIQPAMNACAYKEHERLDARLNQVYRAKMMSLPAPRQKVLRGLQRRWIVERDQRCKLKGAYQMAAIEMADCLSSETTERTAWLGKYR